MGQNSSRALQAYAPVPAADGNGLYYPRHDPTLTLPEGMTHEQLDEELDSLDKFASFLESKWKVFGGRVQIGVDTIVSFIPVVGDVTTGLCSLYVVRKSSKLRVARWRRSLIKWNALVDFTVGLIPFAGAVFNAWFACNRRNTNHILRNFGRKPGVQASLRVADNARDIPETPYAGHHHTEAAFAPQPSDFQSSFPPPQSNAQSAYAPQYAGPAPMTENAVFRDAAIPVPSAPAI